MQQIQEQIKFDKNVRSEVGDTRKNIIKKMGFFSESQCFMEDFDDEGPDIQETGLSMRWYSAFQDSQKVLFMILIQVHQKVVGR